MARYGSIDWKVSVGTLYLATVPGILSVGLLYNLLSNLRYFRDLRQVC